MHLEVVATFKYLGLMFDSEGSVKCMISHLLTKGNKVFHWLRKHVVDNNWKVPHTRLVLLMVYVRSVLQFGAPVWATNALVK